MEKKIILTVVKKIRKLKKKEQNMSLEAVIEDKTKGLYEFRKAIYSNAVETVKKINPNIVWLFDDGKFDVDTILKEIHSINSQIAIFIMVTGNYEDEQEVGDYFVSLGAYKCYFIPPLLLDSLIHDMYVALNME